MVNTLKTLCALSGVSSFEDEVRNYIIGRVSPYADSLRVDTIGNLIVFKKGAKSTGNKLMLCAHMDEVGLIVKSITDDGYLKFGCVGGIDRRVLLGKRVAIGDKRVTGIIGLKAIHLTTPEERRKVPKLDEYYIDIGVKDRESAEKLVTEGDCGVFVSDVVEFGDRMLKAKAIDDRVGCAGEATGRGTSYGLHLRVHRAGRGGHPGRVRRGVLCHAGDRHGAGGHHCGGQPFAGRELSGLLAREGPGHLLDGWQRHL